MNIYKKIKGQTLKVCFFLSLLMFSMSFMALNAESANESLKDDNQVLFEMLEFAASGKTFDKAQKKALKKMDFYLRSCINSSLAYFVSQVLPESNGESELEDFSMDTIFFDIAIKTSYLCCEYAECTVLAQDKANDCIKDQVQILLCISKKDVFSELKKQLEKELEHFVFETEEIDFSRFVFENLLWS